MQVNVPSRYLNQFTGLGELQDALKVRGRSRENRPVWKALGDGAAGIETLGLALIFIGRRAWHPKLKAFGCKTNSTSHRFDFNLNHQHNTFPHQQSKKFHFHFFFGEIFIKKWNIKEKKTYRRLTQIGFIRIDNGSERDAELQNAIDIGLKLEERVGNMEIRDDVDVGKSA